MKPYTVTETKLNPSNSLNISNHPSKEAGMSSRLQQQRKKRQKGETNISLIRNCVGVIRSKWYNKHYQLMTFSYGTAFLISPRILITCTHNLFSKFRSTWAHEVEFVPGIQQGEIYRHYNKIRKSLDFQGKLQGETYKVRHIYSLFDLEKEPFLRECVSFQNNPQNFEVSLVVLEERANKLSEEAEDREEEKQQLGQNYCQKSKEGYRFKKMDKNNGQWKYISLREYSLAKPLPLTIVGYPSQKFRTCISFDKAYVKRTQNSGRPYFSKSQTKDNIIHYCIPTSVGMSGSPILVCDGDTYSAVGIHTHRGQEQGYNSGIYFDKEILGRIKELQRKIQGNERIECYIDFRDSEQGIQQVNEKEENDEDTPSVKENLSKANSSRVNSPMDEKVLPQYQELCDNELNEMSVMSDQSDTSNHSEWSKTSEMSQLDGIYEFFTLVKEPLCDSQPIRAVLTNSCDLSKLSFARLQHYSKLSQKQGRTGSRIAHF